MPIQINGNSGHINRFLTWVDVHVTSNDTELPIVQNISIDIVAGDMAIMSITVYGTDLNEYLASRALYYNINSANGAPNTITYTFTLRSLNVTGSGMEEISFQKKPMIKCIIK